MVVVVLFFASLSFAFSFLAVDVVEILVDVADGLTRKMRVVVREEVVDHLTYPRPDRM